MVSKLKKNQKRKCSHCGERLEKLENDGRYVASDLKNILFTLKRI